ncbi:MAG: AAA family ATPase [Chitinophagaceae bacterium]|nr:AAA family ATPase [Oligoflexus sp.]
MREIYFFTSNRTKLAHLKHLGRLSGVDVIGFRELTYRGSYDEPRISNRADLLAMSYESAAKKWALAFGESDYRIFFFEDTSVRIEALSEVDDVPGVDVKFWMQGMTFNQLDEMLKLRRNIRGATVRSDMVAHIPKRLRTLLGAGKPYIWVHAEVAGSIVSSNVKVKPHLVYPWLDDKSFNKWFVPLGESRPLSMLDKQRAAQHDFRGHAFQRLLSELKGLVSAEPEEASPLQIPLPGMFVPPVWVVCGYSCAGKTTLAEWLSAQYGFLHLEASDYMRQEYWERHGVSSAVSVGDFASAALAIEPWVAAKPIGKDIKRFGYPAVIVTGFRSPNELDALQKELGSSHQVVPIFIHSSVEVRLERSIKRQREAVSPASFAKRDRQERSMGLDEIEKIAIRSTLSNNGSSVLAYTKLFYKKFNKEIESLSNSIHETDGVSMGNLERLIIQALLNAEVALTTSEIAKAIDFYFLQTKSKNNVSRYFNQGFHPFYRAEQSSGAVAYRLSATGLSIAELLQVPIGHQPTWDLGVLGS